MIALHENFLILWKIKPISMSEYFAYTMRFTTDLCKRRQRQEPQHKKKIIIYVYNMKIKEKFPPIVLCGMWKHNMHARAFSIWQGTINIFEMKIEWMMLTMHRPCQRPSVIIWMEIGKKNSAKFLRYSVPISTPESIKEEERKNNQRERVHACVRSLCAAVIWKREEKISLKMLYMEGKNEKKGEIFWHTSIKSNGFTISPSLWIASMLLFKWIKKRGGWRKERYKHTHTHTHKLTHIERKAIRLSME